jgi:hypothetical protein
MTAITNDDALSAARDVLVQRYLRPMTRPIEDAAVTGITATAIALARSPLLERPIAVLAAAPRQFFGDRPIRTRPSYVHAVGIGGKNGSDDRAVIVYVTHKLPKDQVPAGELVPESIDGVRTDVVQSRVPRLAACSDARKGVHRPLMAGVSIGREQGPSGTIGAFARSTRAGDPPDAVLLLSNSHVLGTRRDARVVQPSTDDGEAGAVGRVMRGIRLTTTRPIAADAAIARLDDGAAIQNEVCSIGRITGTGMPAANAAVEKHGRTSGRTAGVIKTTGLAAEVLDGKRRLQFLNVFRVEREAGDDRPLAQLGDSGSLVMEAGTGTAVGLLYAADPLEEFYLAQPIRDVCTELEIELKMD